MTSHSLSAVVLLSLTQSVLAVNSAHAASVQRADVAVALPGANDMQAARGLLMHQHPGVRMVDDNGRLARIFGVPFGEGSSPETSAAAFVAEHAGVFGVVAEDLSTRAPWEGGDHVLPLMVDPVTGDWKFFLVGFSQEIHGIPVFRSFLRLLTANRPGFPLVLASADMHDLGEFRDLVVQEQPQLSSFQKPLWSSQALKLHAPTARVVDEQLVIWAGYETLDARPRVAVQFVVRDNDLGPTRGEPVSVLYVVDARTGGLLFEENQICHMDITGHVEAIASDFDPAFGFSAWSCVPASTQPLPYSNIVYAGQYYYADANGNFTIPGASTGTVSHTIGGLYFRVTDFATPTTPIDALAAGLPVTLSHLGTSESDLARANAYIHANLTRDFALSHSPSFPAIGLQYNFGTNVMLAAVCNAFYDGYEDTINFFGAGAGCDNTAFGSVVHHEYGHHLVAMAGSGQGAYGEGMGDVLGVLLGEASVTGVGFILGVCDNGLRDADNACQFDVNECSSCGIEIHDCGQLLSGCVWDLTQHANGGFDVAADLAVNSMPLHNGTLIRNLITIDYILLDDDDADLTNGTPHLDAIEQSFAAHGLSSGITTPGLFLEFTEAPHLLTLAGGDAVSVIVSAVGSETVDSGTFELNWRNVTTAPGGAFTQVAMLLVGSEFVADLPGGDCLEVIEYFVSVDSLQSNTWMVPALGSGQPLRGTFATDESLLDFQDMEVDNGWTVGSPTDLATTGVWERGEPELTLAQPGSDASAVGTQCWVTGAAAQIAGGANDVDHGSTTLTSPSFAANDTTRISFSIWYSNNRGAFPASDELFIQISNDDGASWVELETIPAAGSTNAWVVKEYDIARFITPGAQTRIRFIAQDLPLGSVVEAAVDDFAVTNLICEADFTTPGDVTGDGLINGADIAAVLANWGGTAADVNHDGVTDGADILVILANW